MRPSTMLLALGVAADIAGIVRLIFDSHALVGHLWIMSGVTWIYLALVLSHLERRR